MTVRLPAAQRREQLLDVALGVFAAEGFKAATMDAVAHKAGVTKPVLYQHFPSKRGLFLELLRDVGARLSEAVSQAAMNADAPRARVTDGFTAYFRFVAAHPDEFRLLLADGVRSDAEFAHAVSAVEDAMVHFIADLIIVEGLLDSDRLVLAHGVVGLAENTGRAWLAMGTPGDADTMATRVADLVWLGLRGRPDSIS